MSPCLVTLPLNRVGDGRWGVHGGSTLSLPSHAAASQEPVSVAGNCDTIYRGFAGCLISLGDSMAQRVRQQREEAGAEAQELDTICK